MFNIFSHQGSVAYWDLFLPQEEWLLFNKQKQVMLISVCVIKGTLVRNVYESNSFMNNRDIP